MDGYDLCVIGAGPAGYAAAMRAIDFGKRVLLVEKARLGGAGLHNGALSSKTFWEIAQDMQRWRKENAKFGLPPVDVPYSELANEVARAVDARTSQLRSHLAACNACEEHLDVHYLEGTAILEGNHQVRVENRLRNATFQGRLCDPGHREPASALAAHPDRRRGDPHE